MKILIYFVKCILGKSSSLAFRQVKVDINSKSTPWESIFLTLGKNLIRSDNAFSPTCTFRFRS